MKRITDYFKRTLTRRSMIVYLIILILIIIVLISSTSNPEDTTEVATLKETISLQNEVMELDNKAFIRMGDMGTYCANGFEEAFNHEADGMEEVSNDIMELTSDIEKMADEKDLLLEKIANLTY